MTRAFLDASVLCLQEHDSMVRLVMYEFCPVNVRPESTTGLISSKGSIRRTEMHGRHKACSTPDHDSPASNYCGVSTDFFWWQVLA